MRKEKPILFSTPMVQAILDDRKTQTRRVIKGVKTDWEFEDLCNDACMIAFDKDGYEYPKDVDGLWATFHAYDAYYDYPMFKASYEVGDTLWVREAFTKIHKFYHYKASCDRCNDEVIRCAYCTKDVRKHQDVKWKSSIHMPRAAARIFLRVKDVRVERLQDISVADCIEEGIPYKTVDKFNLKYGNLTHAQYLFMELWNSINAKRGYGWDTNPWVWVYEFERVEQPQ